jgi:uncharacterized membrane protein YbhN (UPF0104 family)
VTGGARGAAALVLLATIVVSAGALARADGVAVLASFARLGAPSALALVLATSAFYVADALRARAVHAAFGHKLELPLGLKLTCASYFVSTLVPLDLLHLPTLVRILSRRGFPEEDAASATAAKSAGTVLLVSVLGLPALPLALRSASSVFGWVLAVWFAIVPGAIVLAALALVAFRRAIGSGRSWLSPAARGLSALASAPRSMAFFALATAAFIASHVLVLEIAASVLCPEVSPGRAALASLGGLAVSYLSPVPGSIGVAEGAVAVLLGNGPGALATALCQRACCWYAALLPGAFFAREAVGPHPRDARG